MELLCTRWRPWVCLAAAALGGALVPLSMAPYGLWPVGILGIALIASSLKGATAWQALGRSFAAGICLFGVGVSWVHVAISQFGNSSQGIAITLTALFVLGLALVFAAPFYLYGRWLSRSLLGQTLGFAALWVIGEWLRSWLFTGFPWLYLGYGHINTPLNGFAPVLGIFGVSLAVCLSAAALLWLRELCRGAIVWRHCAVACTGVAGIWLAGFGLQHINWTQEKPHAIQVGLMQPNIPQEQKWDPTYYSTTLDTFSELSEPLWDLDWVIWPEAAVPYPYHQAAPLLNQIDEFAKARGTVFITGIIYDDYSAYKYYNAIVARGVGGGEYFKQRLVPFGEYVPFEEQLRGLIAFFNLPTSIIHKGPFNTAGLNANGVMVAAAICYEIVYPDLIAELAADKDVILTISNDAWFGDSIGPLQHFEMARMRAIETGRYVIRATNNGISGFIDPKGRVVTRGGRFTREAISGEVFRMAGATPFLVWRSWPVVLMALFIVICCTINQRFSAR
ncbi:MAG TPA: apolipoprotein N-acyltransferase [Marinagarivorans sp.]